MGLLDDAIREHLDLKRSRGADPGEIERLEREALGPVRRERNLRDIDSVPHLEVHPEHGLEPLHIEEHPTEFHHDPTLHAEPAADPYFEAAPPAPEPPAPEPKRGFLRRSRPASLADSGPTDFTQHLDAELHDELPPELHHEPAADFHEEMPTELHAMHEFEEQPPHADSPAASEPPHPHADTPAASEPPHLSFDAPLPQRPDFSIQPPGHAPAEQPPVHEPDEPVQPAAAVPPPAPPVVPAAPAPPPPSSTPTPAAPVSYEDEDEPGATREWDVEDAFAAEDDRHHAPPPPAEEDVLEETPEFLQDTPDHDRLWFEQRPPRDFDFDG